MLDGCGIETLACSSLAARLSGRDRCSMAVESRPLPAGLRVAAAATSRSMLDGCGIETGRRPASGRSPSWSRSMLDGCGIETLCDGSSSPTSRPSRDRCSMAVESRQTVSLVGRQQRPWSRSMLDGCGIETLVHGADPLWTGSSRSMLDGCGIETSTSISQQRICAVRRDRCSMAVESKLLGSAPAPDALARSRSMLDGCGIETHLVLTPGHHPARSRSMLDGCGIETSLPCGEAYPR